MDAARWSLELEGPMRARSVRDRNVNTAAPPISTFIFVSCLVRPAWLFEVDAMAVIDG